MTLEMYGKGFRSIELFQKWTKLMKITRDLVSKRFPNAYQIDRSLKQKATITYNIATILTGEHTDTAFSFRYTQSSSLLNLI
jgi:hypothetical protein